MKKRIIVLTRCYNEARQLGSFLDMCGEISDGVLLLDDHSTDGSLDIAENHKSVLMAWDSYCDTSAHVTEGADWVSLLSAARAYNPEWVLLLDADERIDPIQFNNHIDKILKVDANMINLMWPFYNELTNKWTYWGYGPNNNQNQIKLKFKKNVFMKFEDIATVNPNISNTKPKCKNTKQVYTNLVLQHLCIRPAKERLNKWQRRMPIESEIHLGYPKQYLLDHISKIEKLDDKSPTTDKWVDSMEKEYGSTGSVNQKDFYISEEPSWEMLISHVPEMEKHRDKEILR
jgi:glycosyltransferase involved in cell wall biosynthesis